MLFRTRVFLAFSTLAAMAVGGAVLLIVSAHLNERVQTRTALAHETLSAYFELSGAIFRTFKLVRRDLLSENGKLALDFPGQRLAILTTLDQIEAASQAEAQFAGAAPDNHIAQDVKTLRLELQTALDDIDQAAQLIASGARAEGEALAVTVLEGRVDVRIASLMDAAIARERAQLETARANLQRFHTNIRIAAWVMVLLSLGVAAIVLGLLVRRFTYALSRLAEATQAYADDRLDQRIDLSGQDELSDVARRMETMAGQIQTKHRALEQIQAELEQRVADRTTELSEVNRELEERARRRRQFFADIGHELRTPVTAIRGEAEVALRTPGEDPATYKDALSQIVSLTERLTDSVNDLFLMAREQAGMLDFRNTLLDLNDPVRQAVSDMRALVEDRAATLQLDLSPGTVPLEGETSRLQQLVRILVSNALTHGGQGVEILLHTQATADAVSLRVVDNGPGVPAEDQRQIFDRYSRGSAAAAQRASGTGLGLAIAKSITNAHGGTICVREAKTGGAEFEVTLPRAEAAS